MTKQRIEGLSDAIFAIVMTLLVIEIKVPELSHFSETGLWDGIVEQTPLLLSFFLSFGILANYWNTQGFLVSLMAKNTDRIIGSLNLIFLMFISLIPFSAHLLGSYHYSKVAIGFYSINILIISVISYLLRQYIHNSEKIENPDPSELKIVRTDRVYGASRIILTVGSSILATLFSFINTNISLVFLVVPVIINFVPGLLAIIMRITYLEKLAKETEE